MWPVHVKMVFLVLFCEISFQITRKKHIMLAFFFFVSSVKITYLTYILFTIPTLRISRVLKQSKTISFGFILCWGHDSIPLCSLYWFGKGFTSRALPDTVLIYPGMGLALWVDGAKGYCEVQRSAQGDCGTWWDWWLIHRPSSWRTSDPDNCTTAAFT